MKNVNKKLFKNIQYPIAIDRGLGRLREAEDYEKHIKNLIMQVLLTGPGERINRPDFGCGVRQMVFAPNSQITANLAKLTIHQALNQWLGSIIVINEVKVIAVEEKLQINIAYTIRAIQQKRYLNVEI